MVHKYICGGIELPGSRSSSLLSYVYIHEWVERLKALMGFIDYDRLMCFCCFDTLAVMSVLLAEPSSCSRKNLVHSVCLV